MKQVDPGGRLELADLVGHTITTKLAISKVKVDSGNVIFVVNMEMYACCTVSLINQQTYVNNSMVLSVRLKQMKFLLLNQLRYGLEVRELIISLEEC